MADGQKTEKATPKKRRDERKKGNIFFSNDAVSVVVLLVSFLVLRLSANWIAAQIYEFLRYCMDLIAQPSMEVPAEGSGLFIHLLGTFVKAAVPLMAAAAAAGVVATFFQTKLLVSGESLRPKLSRISPLQGVKRLFSLRSVVEALKGLLKIAVLLILIFRYITNVLDLFTKYLYTDLLAACAHLFEESFLLSMQIGAAFAVLAAADIFYQWWDYERQIRMSKQEIKEEFKITLEILANDRTGLLADVTQQFFNMHVPIHTLNSRETKDGRAAIVVSITINGRDHLQNVVDRLSRIEGVSSVRRP